MRHMVPKLLRLLESCPWGEFLVQPTKTLVDEHSILRLLVWLATGAFRRL